ncbi:MAG: hypothetical protein NZT61_05370, partial [Deltaproteobacteria bacterium]|nr:hypothetical protein [Deltaproteobacteria bacterium]
SGAVVSVDGNSTFKGGKAEWNEQAAQRIFGSQALNAYTPVDRSAWEYAFLSGKLNLQPISLFVGSDTGRHILLIEKVQNGRVYLIDSIDTKYEYFKSLFSSARAEGTTSWSVSVEDLLDSGKIAYVIAPRDSFVSFRPLSEAIQHGLDDFCVIAHLMSEQEKARLYLGKNKSVRRRSS